MTQILALDTSTDACSVALNVNGQVTGRFELAARSHTQRLLPMVDELLQECDSRLEDLTAIAFGRGPGSFTGLRIGLGVVQGLAFARRLPVIPVSTLAALAVGYWRRNPDAVARPVLSALDARMDEVYWGLYARRPAQTQQNSDQSFDQQSDQSLDQSPHELLNEQVAAPSKVVECVRAWTGKESSVNGLLDGVGPGWHYPSLQSIRPHRLEQEAYPDAQDIARMALEIYQQSGAISVNEVQPVYLRDTVSWKKRTRIRS